MSQQRLLTKKLKYMVLSRPLLSTTFVCTLSIFLKKTKRKCQNSVLFFAGLIFGKTNAYSIGLLKHQIYAHLTNSEQK